MKREQIESNHAKLKQLNQYEYLREQMIVGKNGWWKISTAKVDSCYVSNADSRERFMAWLESEIAILKKDLELEEEE